jgi:hypothetical protein
VAISRVELENPFDNLMDRNGSKVLRIGKDSSEDCRSWICKYYDLKQIQFMDSTG